MPKYSVLRGEWGRYDIPCLGFPHPNYAYLSICMIALLAGLVYKERIKWYGWIGITFILMIFYKVLYCRTGWYIWLLTLVMILFYMIADKIHLKEIYIRLLCLVPPMLAGFSLLMVCLYSKGNAFAAWVNDCFTGRISYAASNCLPTLFVLFANPARTANEIEYIQFPYNYGWILYIICLIIYIRTMWLLAKEGEDYYVMIYTSICFYFLGEGVPLSAGWNVSLLLISRLLFRKGNGARAHRRKPCFKKNQLSNTILF